MPLPAGSWKANLNGTVVDLTIGGVNPQGMVPVTLLTVNTQGFWNEVAQSLSIGLVVNFGEASAQASSQYSRPAYFDRHRIHKRDRMSPPHWRGRSG